jgi:acetone carboxylase beta subunit
MAAAEGICKVLDATMGSTLRSALAIKGADMSQYALFAYGGAGATHVAGFTAGMNFKEIIIPSFAAVFCAFGASTADIVHRYESSPFTSIRGIPYDHSTLRFDLTGIKSLDELQHEGLDRFNQIFTELEERAREDISAEGLKQKEVSFNYEVLARYGGQLWELRTRIPVNRVSSVKDLEAIVNAFQEHYYDEYGLQAMAPRGGLQIVTIAVEVVGSTLKPTLVELEDAGESADKALKGERDVYIDGSFKKCRIYTQGNLLPGNVITGPSIIEGTDTTVVIPGDRKVIVDGYLNMLMRYR